MIWDMITSGNGCKMGKCEEWWQVRMKTEFGIGNGYWSGIWDAWERVEVEVEGHRVSKWKEWEKIEGWNMRDAERW